MGVDMVGLPAKGADDGAAGCEADEEEEEAERSRGVLLELELLLFVARGAFLATLGAVPTDSSSPSTFAAALFSPLSFNRRPVVTLR